MSEKQNTACKSPFIDSELFEYPVEFEGNTYTMQVLSFRQRAKAMRGLGEKTTVNDRGDTIITTDMESFLIHMLSTILAALKSWTLKEPCTPEIIERLHPRVINALYQAINDHEANIQSKLGTDEKN